MGGSAPDEASIVAAGLVAVVAYVLGSLPLAGLIGRAYGVDPWTEGDGNPGSANVWHLAGPRAGALTLVADMLKGTLAVALGWAVFGFGTAILAAVAVVAGHAWPALGRRRGGRAVAPFAGACIGLAPLAAAGSILLTVAVLAVGGRVPAIVSGIASFPILFWLSTQDARHTAALLLLYAVTLARFRHTETPRGPRVHAASRGEGSLSIRPGPESHPPASGPRPHHR